MMRDADMHDASVMMRRQAQVLQDQFPMAPERQRQAAADYDKQLQHASIVAGVGAKFNADEFWRGSPQSAMVFYLFGKIRMRMACEER
jgi:hypothetical protein